MKLAPFDDPQDIKVYILCLLDRIGYPLKYPTIRNIMLQDGNITFYDFVDCFDALAEGGLVTPLRLCDDGTFSEFKPSEKFDFDNEPFDAPVEKDEDGYTGNRELRDAYFRVSAKGRLVVESYAGSLMLSIRERSYRNALRYLSFEKSGANVSQDYEKSGDAYIYHCRISDKNGDVMKLDIKVDNIKQIERIRENFMSRPEDIYRGFISLLNGDVNYIFEL